MMRKIDHHNEQLSSALLIVLLVIQRIYRRDRGTYMRLFCIGLYVLFPSIVPVYQWVVLVLVDGHVRVFLCSMSFVIFLRTGW